MDQIIRTPLALAPVWPALTFSTMKAIPNSRGNWDYLRQHQPRPHSPALRRREIDYFFNPSGNPTDENGTPTNALVPIPTTFTANRNTLDPPRYLMEPRPRERKTSSRRFYLKLSFLKNAASTACLQSLSTRSERQLFSFQRREHRYDAFQISARHRFREPLRDFRGITTRIRCLHQPVSISASTSALEPQLPGPLSLGRSHRIIGWAICLLNLPTSQIRCGLSGEAPHWTPFSRDHRSGEIVPAIPGTFRLPMYYT